MKKYTLIAAVTRNGVIGDRNMLPWHLPDEITFFKRTTEGSVVIMGSQTFRSIRCLPLPDRINIVATSDPRLFAPEADTHKNLHFVTSFDQAAALADRLADGRQVFVMGGRMVYSQALSSGRIGEIILSEIDLWADGDTFFPYEKVKHFSTLSVEDHQDATTGIKFQVRSLIPNKEGITS